MPLINQGRFLISKWQHIHITLVAYAEQFLVVLVVQAIILELLILSIALQMETMLLSQAVVTSI